MDTLENTTNNIKTEMLDFVGKVRTFMNETIDDVASMSKCFWIGNLFQGLWEDSICGIIGNSFEILSALNLMLGFTYFITFYFAIFGCYFFGRTIVKDRRR